jgi:hypothetical protein
MEAFKLKSLPTSFISRIAQRTTAFQRTSPLSEGSRWIHTSLPYPLTNWLYRREYRLKPLCYTQRKHRFLTIDLHNNFVSSLMPNVTAASYQPLCPRNGLQEVFITISNESGDRIKGFRGSYLAHHYSSLHHAAHPNGPSDGGGGETTWAGVIAVGGPFLWGIEGLCSVPPSPSPSLATALQEVTPKTRRSGDTDIWYLCRSIGTDTLAIKAPTVTLGIPERLLISPVNERMVEIFSMFTDQPLILTYGAHSTLLWFLYPFGASLFLGYKIGWWIERFPRKG